MCRLNEFHNESVVRMNIGKVLSLMRLKIESKDTWTENINTRINYGSENKREREKQKERRVFTE